MDGKINDKNWRKSSGRSRTPPGRPRTPPGCPRTPPGRPPPSPSPPPGDLRSPSPSHYYDYDYFMRMSQRLHQEFYNQTDKGHFKLFIY